MSIVLTSENAGQIALNFLLKNKFIESAEDVELNKVSAEDNVFQDKDLWSLAFFVHNGWGEYRTWFFELESSDLSVCRIFTDHAQTHYYRLESNLEKHQESEAA